MSVINSFVDDLNKSVLNGLTVGEKNLKNIVNDTANNTNKGLINGVLSLNKNITDVQNNVKYALRNVDNDINKSIDDSIKYIYKNRDSGLVQKTDRAVRVYSAEHDKVKQKADKSIRQYGSVLDKSYVWLYNLLIRPYKPRVPMTHKDYSFTHIIITFVLLVITTTNTYIVANTFDKIQDRFERLIGYRFDGRKIGKTIKSNKFLKKFTFITKIIRTFLLILASFLDLILMAFLNQSDVVATMVKGLLGKK